jgi:hypothetical protein
MLMAKNPNKPAEQVWFLVLKFEDHHPKPQTKHIVGGLPLIVDC